MRPALGTTIVRDGLATSISRIDSFHCLVTLPGQGMGQRCEGVPDNRGFGVARQLRTGRFEEGEHLVESANLGVKRREVRIEGRIGPAIDGRDVSDRDRWSCLAA